MQAFSTLCNAKTKLIVFSDDMDGLRKVPDNVPNKEMMEQYLGYRLTAIPDPFGTHRSFGEHNNAKLCESLSSYNLENGRDYEFKSSTQEYQSGRFNSVLEKI